MSALHGRGEVGKEPYTMWEEGKLQKRGPEGGLGRSEPGTDGMLHGEAAPEGEDVRRLGHLEMKYQ